MFFALILVGVYSKFTDIAYGDGLGPREVSWPSAWVNNQIQVDSNYIDDQTTVSIYFSVDDLDTDFSGYYAGIKLPADDSFTASSSIARLSTGSSDWVATFSKDLTTDETFGPIHFVLSPTSGGEIFAEDVALGYVALWTGGEPDPGDLTVTLYSTAESPVFEIQSDVTLQFSFALGEGDDLYPGDYFVLSLATEFPFDYESVVLTWDTDEADSAYFADMQVDVYVNPGADLTVTTDDSYIVYIYGLNQEVNGGATVTFRLEGFSAPSSYRASSAGYNWELEAWRYGTNTMIAQYAGTGPASEITTGTISITSWGPNNANILSTQLVDGIVAWFKLEFKVEHAVPALGTIVVTYANVDIDDYKYSTDSTGARDASGGSATASVYCTASVAVTCVASSATSLTITVGANAAIPAEGSVVVYTITKLSGATYDISDIVSKTEGVNIDELSDTDTKKSLTRASSGVAAISSTAFLSYLTTSATSVTGINTINKKSTYGYLLQFTSPSTALPANTVINIHLPFTSASTVNAVESSLVFGSTGYNYYSQDDADVFTTTTFADTPASGATVAFSTDKIALTLAAANTGTNILIFYIGSGSAELAGNVATPLISTRLSELKEVVVKFTISVSSVSTVHYIVAPYYYQAGSITTSVTLFCDNLFSAGPAWISYNVDIDYTPPTGYELYVYFTLTQSSSSGGTFAVVDLLTDLGLSSTDNFPTSDSGKTFSITSSNEFYYKTTSLDDTAVKFAIIVPSVAANQAFKVKADAYVVKSSVKTLVFTGTSAEDVAAASGSAAANVAITDIADKAVSTDFDASTTFTVTASTSYSTLAVLPQGFSTSDTGINTKSITSTSAYSKYSVYYKEGAFTTSTETSKVVAYTLKTGWYEKSAAQFAVAAHAAATHVGGTCIGTLETLNVITASSLTISDCKPSTLGTYLYNNKVTDISANFKAAGILLKGSTIVIEVGAWAPSDIVVKTGTDTISGTLASTTWTSSVTIKEYAANTIFTVSATSLTVPSAASTTQTIITSVQYKYDGNIYYDSDTISTCKTTVTASTSITSKKSGATMWVFPDVVGSEDVYFGLSFTTSIAITTGSTLKIAGTFTDRSDAKFDVWCSHAYSSVTISSNNVEIVLSEAISSGTKIEVVVDSALDLTSTTVSNVLVTVTASDSSSTVLVDDSSLASGVSQKYTVKAAPSLGVEEFVYAVGQSNAGMSSLYQFNLTFDNVTDEEYILHLDASIDYNALPGPVYELDDFPGDNFILAFDNDMNLVLCTASHWLVSCYLEGSSDSISIWLYLDNPQVEGSWSAYVTDLDWNVLAEPAYTESGSELDFSNDLTNDIDLYFANPNFDDDETGFSHNLDLWAFVDIAAVAGSEFTVMFPYPYNVEDDNSVSVGCSITYYNGADTIDEVLGEDTVCEIDGNSVTFTLSEAKTFASTNWTIFSLYEVVTPDGGFERDAWIYDTEVPDFSTGKFCIVYGDGSGTISAASFDNLNAAFTGFDENGDWFRLYVEDGEEIALTPGTVSGPYFISSEDGEIDAEEISISILEIFGDDGESVDGIEIYSDDEELVIDYISTSAEFYIGVSSEVITGSYYISWSIVETPFGNKKYVKPRNTILQVSTENIYEIVSLDEEVFVPSGIYSFPITFAIDDSIRAAIPFEGLDLNFESDADVEVLFRPNPLRIDREWTENYVSIRCDECVSGTVYTYTISLEGADSEAFYVAESFTFTAGSEYDAAAVASVEISEDDIKSNGFKVSITSDSNAIVTWAVYSEFVEDDYDVEYDDLLETVFVLGSGNTTNPTVDEKVEAREKEIESFRDEYDNYRDLTKAIFDYYRLNPVTGQSLIAADTPIELELYYLAPNTKYYFIAYVDNLSGDEVEAIEVEATTLKLPAHAKLTLSFTGSYNEDDLKETLAKFFQLPTQNIDFGDSRRRLQSQTETMVYSSADSSTSAYDTANNNKADLESATGATVSVESVSADDYVDAEFDGIEWITDNGISLGINFTSTSDGQLICTIINGTGIETSTDDVYSGLDDEGNDADQTVDDVVADTFYSWSWNFTELEYEPSTYTVSCIVCNDFPGDPSCSEVESTNYTYTGEEDNEADDSSASVFIYAVAAYFVF